MIILSIPYHRIGGAEKVHLEIVKSLNSKPIILFDNIDKIGSINLFKDYAHCFGLRSKRKQKIFKFLIDILVKLIPITFFGCNSSFFYSVIPKLSKRIKIIDLTHAFSYPDHGSEIVSLPCVKNIDFRIVINQKTLDDYKILYKRNNISEKYINHFRIIPNGITIQKFDENLIKKRFDQFTIGFVGRNSKEKRSELFFQLVGLLKLKGKVIGDDFSEFKPNFKGISYFEGCNDSTLIRKEFSTISLLVVSSSREGFPLVVMEAMEMGIPVIASNVGSIYEHVKDDINGYLAPSDPVAFVLYVAEKVNYLNANLHLYKSLSINARQYAEENFNIIQFRKEYINLLS